LYAHIQGSLSFSSLLARIIHEYGEIWVEQGFSPAFTARLDWRLLAAEVHTVGNSGIASGPKALMAVGFSAGLKACSTLFMNIAC
jgi:hypothetical protein